MEPDSLKQYLECREALVEERRSLGERLAEIDKALGISGEDVAAASPLLRISRNPAKKKARSKAGRRKGQKSLKAVLCEILGDAPMTKEEILAKVQEAGHKFSTSNPVNSVYTTLNSNKDLFKNDSGRFSRQQQELG